MLYINGAAGNLAPIYSVYPDFKGGHLDQFNVLLGDRILAAQRSISHATEVVTLWVGESIVETPREAELGWAEDLQNYLRIKSAGTAVVRTPVRFFENQ